MRLNLILLLVSVGWLWAATLRAAPVGFDIPAQPGHTALMAFARTAGADVLFAAEELKRVRTTAVVGTFEPDAALEQMLAGTGFTGERTTKGKFVVRRTPTPSEQSARPLPPKPPKKTRSGGGRVASYADEIVRLDRMVVAPSRFGVADERLAVDATLTSAQLEVLPQLGEDLYRTIARMPGLVADDLTAMFWVRGAPNRQVLSRLDGVDLIEPFHLKDYDGSISIVDLETIASINLITSGFTANYGDRLTGVLEMETQADPGGARRTTLGLSLTHLRASSQGEFAEGRGQWLAAARRGYIDLAIELGGTEVEQAPSYYDLSGKVSYQLGPNHTVSFHVLHAGDQQKIVDARGEPDLRTRYDSNYAWTRWRGRFGERVSSEAVLSLAHLNWQRNGDGFYDEIHPFFLRDDRQLDVWSLRNDWTVNLTENALVRAGLEHRSAAARYDYTMSRAYWAIRDGNLVTDVRTRDARLRPEGQHTGAFVAPRFRPWSPLIVEPGLRFDRDTHNHDSSWSPRLNTSLTLGSTVLRAAWGIYEQAQGLHELSVRDGETAFHRNERAEQRVLGVSRRLRSGINLRLELYDRRIARPRPHWENLINYIDEFPEAGYDRVAVHPTAGRAQGIEVIAEQRYGGRFSWSASYACARTEEKVGGRWIPRTRDQRHTFYADVAYSPAPYWQIGCAWQFHTGWPVTDLIIVPLTLNDGTQIQTWEYGPMNAKRAPNYHRLDLRATRTFILRRGTLRAFVDIFNVYSHKNEYGFDNPLDDLTQGRVNVSKRPLKMFPIIPSFGLSWEY
jgi:hypothetical protein